MSQVELPQISLQRYVDLLKRRRWQLVPVSLLGLIVGGAVAFLIPRYYVAETLLQHEMVGQRAPGEEDPFLQIVDTAELTIPLRVEETMRELKWPEATTGDLFEVAQNVKAVRDQVHVIDINRERGRSYAQIKVTFRDQIGSRVATFLNTLLDIWIKGRIEDLRAPRLKALQEANDRAGLWNKTYEGYYKEKEQIERLYGIAPNLDPLLQQMALRERNATLLQRQNDLLAAQKERAQVKQELDQQNAKLDSMPSRIVPDAADMLTVVKEHPEAATQVLIVEGFKRALDNCVEGTLRRVSIERGLAQQQALLTKMITIDVDADGKIANPEHDLLRAQIAANEAKLAGLDAGIKLLQEQTTAEQTQSDRLIDGFAQYDKKRQELDVALKELDKAREAAHAAEQDLAKLQTESPVHVVQKANTPPAPTEPNVLLVAMVGCLFGLGLAIGLVLLFDLLQATFKTIDDVERGVHVPVLGGMSHLETEDERLSARRVRRRTSLIAVTLTSLVAIIVTIYYVDNTRLPAVVRDMLAMLLGS